MRRVVTGDMRGIAVATFRVLEPRLNTICAVAVICSLAVEVRRAALLRDAVPSPREVLLLEDGLVVLDQHDAHRLQTL